MKNETTIRRGFGAHGAYRAYRANGLLLLLLWLLPVVAFAQTTTPTTTPVKKGIKIGGNVYGGGNKGNVGGSATVTVKAGDINRVYGGARMADVGGNTFVNIDGEEATDYMVINYVYGGNDIAGTIGTAKAVGEELPKKTITTGTGSSTEDILTAAVENGVDNTWNSYVRISDPDASNTRTVKVKKINETTGEEEDELVDKTKKKEIYIGQLFAGGNGEYELVQPSEDNGNTYQIFEKGDRTTPIAENKVGFVPPEIGKAYLEVLGGSIVYAYGGGNNATVTEKTIIHVDNPSTVVNHIEYLDGTTWKDKLTTERFKDGMGINSSYSKPSSDEFQIGRLFGGNNMAEMAIQPTWNLKSGKIRNLYSGGNEGAMTHPKGILLDILDTYSAVPAGNKLTKGDVYYTTNTGGGKFTATGTEVSNGSNYYSNLVVDNVYGGCRMADVRPLASGTIKNGDAVDVESISKTEGYTFPPNFAAHVLINGGNINNVYGGNDVRGRVYFGNTVGIASSIRGDVYGGGNGAYPYTDLLENDPIYGDFWYEPTSIEALNNTRPDAEQVSILLRGKETTDASGNKVITPTVIGGSVYCGGNCATLRSDEKHKNLENYPLVELKIGSHVIAENVFLGNNGAGMIDEDILKLYDDDEFSSLNLKDGSVFADYMEGVALDMIPTVVKENTDNGDHYNYTPYSSSIGSFFCGGNVGSMSYKGKNSMKFDVPIVIYNKVVGGCNNAFVPEGPYNAYYDGGILGFKGTYEGETVDERAETGGKTAFVGQDRLEMTFDGLKIEPKRLNSAGDGLEWNTAKWVEKYIKVPAGTPLTKGDAYYKSATGTGKFYAEASATADDSTYELEAGYENIGTTNTSEDKDRRLLGGNIYGGCYNSGHVNGNIVINIKQDLIKRDEIFPDVDEDEDGNSVIVGSTEEERKCGVMFDNQRDDVLTVALTTFGAGCGYYTEIWGSTTVNLEKGYAFQVFGGGEEGFVGKGKDVINDSGELVMSEEEGIPLRKYAFDLNYSTTVNMDGSKPIYKEKEKDDDLAESEYLYGGGNEGMVCGNSYVHLLNGRIYDAFGGASDADILGHTEVYIGGKPNGDGTYKSGYPFVRDIVYGGNDFGGTIYGGYEDNFDFKKRLRNYEADKKKIHGYDAGHPTKIPEVLQAATYVEYLEGRVDTIFGGGYGYYDYKDKETYGEDAKMPYQKSSFVNIRPNDNQNNALKGVFGGGTGYPKNRDGDKAQDRSYVLIDIPKDENEKDLTNFSNTEVFGSGSYNGLGMGFKVADTMEDEFDPDQLSAIIDLLHGQIGTAYGGSYNEGVTARTVVNVPNGSTIKVKDIFGGAYGTQILPPCDVYESNVNYHSNDATVSGAIFGGNNEERRTLYAKVNITAPVWSNKAKGYTATAYGAGRGIDTWAEYTEVNLLPKRDGDEGDYEGAVVYEVYGGGEMGHVLNAESVQEYMHLYQEKPSPQISRDDPKWKDAARWTGAVGTSELKDGYLNPSDTKTVKEEWAEEWADAWTLGDYYSPDVKDGEGNVTGYDYTKYVINGNTNLTNDALVTKTADIDERDYTGYTADDKNRFYRKYNTNVLIHKGATVAGYAYGGGLGAANKSLSGDVYGNTYIALLGGTVEKDLYAAGTTGAVYDLFGVGAYDATEGSDGKPKNPYGFTATATAYIKGGTARNVYGGGWKGDVGYHNGDINTSYATDIPGETHVVIGDVNVNDFYTGNPAITRNAYAGGEGGSIWGTANITINNGMFGYRYKNLGTEASPDYQYVEELDDAAPGDSLLYDSGNAFGGGYIVNSYVDNTNVKMYGGTIRGSLYGGGEIGPIGRGTIRYVNDYTTGIENQGARIFRAGKTHVEMYNGHVLRNVFGGGRGKDSWGGDGTEYMRKEMTEEAFAALDLQCKGFVFGQTDVRIYGGEVGSEKGMLEGFGNVFGGGDEGSVYSAYEKADGKLAYGKKSGKRYNEGLASNDPEIKYQGYYYKYEEQTTGSYDFVTTAKGEREFTEDCHVLVEPWLQVKNNAVTYPTSGGKTYQVGDYIPTAYLNTLPAKTGSSGWTGGWENLDAGRDETIGGETVFKERGIIIHNAVFAGGNTTEGSSSLSANATTVFGNATASIHDVYHRDLITIGTGHTGGLYGDGNLTFIDGYRELNITNYGTDYYHIDKQLGIDAYKLLPAREQAYYELKYKCKQSCTDIENTTYTEGATLPYDELLALFIVGDKSADANGVAVTAGNESNGILIKNATTNKWEPNSNYWEENGVVSAYAGRIMNTIQRADFCGVFGSRMVMKGAQDRVPETVDYTNYTINRVREVSLNKKKFRQDDPETTTDFHGNYFGIYSIVNYLGALTSDVDFHNTVRTTKADNPTAANGLIEDGKRFAEWKEANISQKYRNNGNCYNQLALASGVYLELTSEQSKGTRFEDKVWGPITGVIELDLINIQPGMGGGFIYAKNEHGVPIKQSHENTTLTALNADAVTQWDYEYSQVDQEYAVDATTHEETGKKKLETSGNFIHSSQTIIDDCYNISNRYLGSNAVPAHYWYVSGSVYVYDQYISAYTGAPNAVSETIDIPITLSAAANGKMTLMDVKPNRYAFYSSYVDDNTNTPLTSDSKLVINDVTYHLNDPISYWEWSKLPASERRLFVESTYVVTNNCKINNKDYTVGMVLSSGEYEKVKGIAEANRVEINEKVGEVPAVLKIVKNESGVYEVAKDAENKDVHLPFYDVFHSSNNMTHDRGYLLTYDVTNPSKWDKWYTKAKSSDREKDQAGGSDYEDGPTFRPTTEGLYGQKEFDVGEVISWNDYTDYEGYKTTSSNVWNYSESSDKIGLKQLIPKGYTFTKEQAKFEPAYVVTSEYLGGSGMLYPGSAVSATQGASMPTGYASPAYICTSTIQLSATEYIYINELLTAEEKQAYYNRFNKTGATDTEKLIAADIDKLIVPAYYCTDKGQYGGSYYYTINNYRALAAWSSMSESDRRNFEFNYDALDLLVDSTYNAGTLGKQYQYDCKIDKSEGALAPVLQAAANPAHYSLQMPVDYTATYNGSASLQYTTDADSKDKPQSTLVDATDATHPEYKELTRTEFESLPNEQRYYAPIPVDAAGDYYVVHTEFIHVENPYAVGEVLSDEAYGKLTKYEQDTYITKISFSAGEVKTDNAGKYIPYYYCRESYTVTDHPVKGIKGVTGNYDSGANVPIGAVISGADNTTVTTTNPETSEETTTISYYSYTNLPNQQKNFTIHGVSPTETSTLYVSCNSDIDDLSSEKIITVIYKYDYQESDDTGMHITPVSERHIVNIHIQFRNGVPTIEDIHQPGTVLPGTSVTMRVPVVTKGAHEIIGGGWEIFEDKDKAESHINGMNYTPSVDPLYWFQDGYYIAYYAKTYLGKTYSNYVPLSVANYHDLKKVMDDKKYHLHVDYDRTRLQRSSKIYINDYTTDDPATTQNGLDLLKDFYNLSLLTKDNVTADPRTGIITATDSPFKDHTLLNTNELTGTNKYDNNTYKRGVKAGQNLEFFLHTDINHPGTWEAIGNLDEDNCFKGNLHGDGHTISGLTNSLFYNLCGNVYNLGVTGSFTSAGVADKDTKKVGYVESCWVKSSATTTTTSPKPYAVFGAPSDDKGYQVVNSYFWNGNKNLYAIEGDDANVDDDEEVITSGGLRGKATAKPEKAFYNGELAYDLNNFYLYKRYSDKNVSSGAETQKYRNYTIGTDNKVAFEPDEYHYYDDKPEFCSSGYTFTDNNVSKTLQYVEERYGNVDFVYADGTIPSYEDERHYIETIINEEGQTEPQSRYFPIWPDDYLFFGQALNYGHVEGRAHQKVPTAIKRSGGRVDTSESGNRVFRAPAYYRNSEMQQAYFNTYAVFAQSEKGNEDNIAYQGMTAIDFTGYNDVNGTYGLGLQNDGRFYPPLLDDEGISGFMNVDLTKNLLVYTPAEGKTATTISDYLKDVAYVETETAPHKLGLEDNRYRAVAEQDENNIYGHWVQQIGDAYVATRDHLLVDREDFNAPIEYKFKAGTSTEAGTRMWYQRKPANFVEPDWTTAERSTNGWEGVSLPFTAELVTTNQKGEITHFYSGSLESKNDTHSKIGHEYWLREFKKISNSSTPAVAVADFNYPTASSSDFDKTVTNTFLWDYYYEGLGHNYKDQNNDTYQTYYQPNKDGVVNTFSHYPRLTAGSPYIIGFPGATFLEFDLSGNYVASTTAVTKPEKLDPQVITFASEEGATIHVSDDETAGVTFGGYTFKPSYMNETLEAGKFVLNTEGNAYNKLSDVPATYNNDGGKTYTETEFGNAGTLYTNEACTEEATSWTSETTTYYKRTSQKTPSDNDKNHVTPSQSAFRPYFQLASPSGNAVKEYKAPTRSIIFNRESSQMIGQEENEDDITNNGRLYISAKEGKIVVYSTLSAPEKVCIVNTAGALIDNYTIQPGETIETSINASGVYVVNKKKLSVKINDNN